MTEWFGDYELLGTLGRGGMGEVYRARKRGYDRIVALKRIPLELSGDPRFRARFERECRIAGRLEHDHIAPIYEFGTHDERLFIAMRLIDGRDLADFVADGPLEPATAIELTAQIASALDYAHDEGVEHRDIKPANIIVAARRTPDGRPNSYLVDFGIARMRDLTALTTTGVVGSAPWMAPERINEDETSDRRADVYSLTCVLFEMLTGRVPFPRQTQPAILFAHVNTPAPAPSELATVPVALDAVVAKGMAKNPDDRYATAGELAAAARAAVATAGPSRHGRDRRSTTTVVPAQQPTARLPDQDRPGVPRRRRSLIAAVAAVVAVAAVIVAGVVLTSRGHHGSATAGHSPTVAARTPQPPTDGQASSAPTTNVSSPPTSRTPATVLSVGTCLTTTGQPVGCQAAHAAEVYSTSTPCSQSTLVRYLGGQPETDTLLPAVLRQSRVVGGRSYCTVHGPQAGQSAAAARNVLRSSAGAAWRLCYDSLNAVSLACSKPHTTEYVWVGTPAAGTSVDCRTKASAYLNAAYADVADQLDVLQAATGSTIACALVVRGGDVLTTTVRSLEEGTLPLEPR